MFTRAKAMAATLISRQGRGGLQASRASAADFMDRRLIKLQGGRKEFYTTQAMVDLERSNHAAAEALHNRETQRLTAKAVAAAVARNGLLSDEQRRVVEHATSSRDIALVQGVAGAGKTFTLEAVADAYKRAGYEVRGLAPSGKAAKNLQDGASVPSTTIARAALDLEGREWEPTQVYIVDEAGMVGTHDMNTLLTAAQRSGAKLLLVGDTKQLQSIQAGAPFRALQDKLGFASLDTVRRQREAVDREIAGKIRFGHSVKAMRLLQQHNRIHTADSGQAAKQQLAADLVGDMRRGVVSYALAEKRIDVKNINDNVRGLRKAAGELSQGLDFETKNGPREFAAGDRVVFLKNVNKASEQAAMGGEVKNGYTGTVRQVGLETLQVELDDGSMRRIDTEKYGHIDHGYALTVHKSQGSTYEVSRNYLSADSFGSLEMGYVAMSRAKGETHLYGEADAVVEAGRRWGEERQKRNALDYEIGTDKHQGQAEKTPQAQSERAEKSREQRQTLKSLAGIVESVKSRQQAQRASEAQQAAQAAKQQEREEGRGLELSL